MYCGYLWPSWQVNRGERWKYGWSNFLAFSVEGKIYKICINDWIVIIIYFISEILNFNYSGVLLKKSFNNQYNFIVNIIHHYCFTHELLYVIDKERETFNKSHIELLKDSHLHRTAI